MSADNWAICPKCQKNRETVSDVEALYGRIPRADYEKRMQAALRPMPVTLREDYALGIQPDGTFAISYGASCKVCGFKFDYSHEEELTI